MFGSASPGSRARISPFSSWINQRLFVGQARIINPADRGKTIALGGGAYYAVTLGLAGGYPSNFQCVLLNEDSVRAKLITVTGGTNFRLYPGQVVTAFVQNGMWRFLGRGRWTLTAPLSIFVDPVNGSDSNDGLAAGTGGAILTPQVAWGRLINEIDTAGQAITFSLAAGTFTTGINVTVGWVGGSAILITGVAVADQASPTTIINPTNANCLNIQGIALPGTISLHNVKVQTTTSGTPIINQAVGQLNLGSIEFGTPAAGYGFVTCIGTGAVIAQDLPCWVTGDVSGGAAPLYCQAGGVMFPRGLVFGLVNTAGSPPTPRNFSTAGFAFSQSGLAMLALGSELFLNQSQPNQVFTGQCTSGSAVITNVPSTAGISVGQTICYAGSGGGNGTFFAVGTTVISFVANTSITVSNNAAATSSLTKWAFGYPRADAAAGTSHGNTTLDGLAANFTNGLQAGMPLQANGTLGIAAGTVVNGINSGTSISISPAATLSATAAVKFEVAKGKKYYVELNGVISTGGAGADFLPGDSAGTTSSSGLYA